MGDRTDWAARMWRLLLSLASAFMIAMTGLWTFWGTAEMYHEGWFGSWTNRLPYLAPIAVTLVPTVLCFLRPIAGGVLLIAIGLAAAGFFHNPAVAAMAAGIALVGVLFALDGWRRRQAPAGGDAGRAGPGDVATAEEAAPAPPSEPDRPEPARGRPWWREDLRATCAVALALAIFVGVSAFNLPYVWGRLDDGDRSARRIDGNGVALVWAPEGPGWNWKQEWGGYPSWHAIALYGMPPVGLGAKPGYGRIEDEAGGYVYATAEDMARTNLCRYLGADGVTLYDVPQDVWRMPTADEVVRSLVRDDANAGCAWGGALAESAECDVRPDKESPLWATDRSPIYYWTADEASEQNGVFVCYNGMVNADRKYGGNPRHSHRCVREP